MFISEADKHSSKIYLHELTGSGSEIMGPGGPGLPLLPFGPRFPGFPGLPYK